MYIMYIYIHIKLKYTYTHTHTLPMNKSYQLENNESGEGNGTPLQYFFLENPIDRGAWQATIHGVSAKSQTQQSDFTCFFFFLTFLGWISAPISFVSLFIFYILSYLLQKTMGCLFGSLMSSASIQKLFCGICSTFKCSFNEFVGEKVCSLSYSSAILEPSPLEVFKFTYLFLLESK